MPVAIQSPLLIRGLFGLRFAVRQAVNSPLPPPHSLTATASADGSVDLAWVNGRGARAALITRSAHGLNNFQQVGIATGSTFTDRGVTDGLTYDYVIYDLD